MPMYQVANAILAREEMPFLQAFADNHGAIRLFRAPSRCPDRVPWQSAKLHTTHYIRNNKPVFSTMIPVRHSRNLVDRHLRF